MILTAHQPVYLPWLGLFHKIAISDSFISFDQVQYQRDNWNNRNRIKTPDGPIWLTVPVLKKGYLDKKICEIEIDNSKPWARKHWRSIRANYAKAPYFKEYADFFEDVYLKHWTTLEELNTYMLRWFLDTLKIDVLIKSAGEYDFRGSKSNLVLDMCKQLSADAYVFGKLGEEYADIDSFESNNIKVIFQDYIYPEYSQKFGGFESNLSIVDLLFNMGDSSFDTLMSVNISKTKLLETISY